MNLEPLSPSLDNPAPVPRGRSVQLVILAFIILVPLMGMALWWHASPAPLQETPLEVDIPSGASLREATEILESSGVVRSATMLQFVVHTFFDNAPIRAGIYVFTEPQSVRSVARIITSGEGYSPLVRLTVPEGWSVAEIDPMVAEILIPVERGDFLTAAAQYEGYLFPDTYFLDPSFDASSTIAFMRENFDEKIEPLRGDIEASGRTLDAILTMASILEKEANDPESMGIVSGILWKRLDEGMRLQVDAPFAYALQKPLADISAEDLEIDSPYNTYRYGGLPPTPIGNPGLTAIKAAVTPISSPYFYYITGDDGDFYYAKTFEEHKANIAKHLRE